MKEKSNVSLHLQEKPIWDNLRLQEVQIGHGKTILKKI